MAESDNVHAREASVADGGRRDDAPMSPAKLLDRDRTLLAESNAIMASAEALYRFRENVVSIELRDTARAGRSRDRVTRPRI